MRRRLFQRIFVTLLLFVVLAFVLSALAGHLLLSELFQAHARPHLEARAAALVRELPGPGGPQEELQAAVERLARSSALHVAVWSREGRRLAFTSVDLPAPRFDVSYPDWLPSRAGPALASLTSDGRVVVLQRRHRPRPAGFLAAVLGLALALALASYPVARLVTRRLESLEAGVRRLGEGDLAVRVDVTGDDELASLAARFNRTAERLQTLVEAQRRMLAMVSHELRSPLARLRMALELVPEDPSGRRIADALVEIRELDALVEELLLVGRLDLQAPAPPFEPVDVAAILGDEAARSGAAVSGHPAPLRVDPRLLRLLVRNLLENAQRHGGGGGIEAGVEPLGEARPGVRLWVADRGPGVPEGERERIFEPFYRRAGQGESAAEGVGLGLYLVSRIARTYDGTAVCLPREGGGSRFEVVLREAIPPLDSRTR